MNTYRKYCPNVFVAKCPEEHKKGDEIIVTTKYGKENECIVYNEVHRDAEGNYYYSIIRADGFNTQERAKMKAERLGGYASNADKRSNEAFEKSDMSEEKTGIVFGQPILVGHHSEKRHRRTIEKAWDNLGKSVKEGEKAEEYRRRAEYWEAKSNEINLSMPESLGYFKIKLDEAKRNHQFLKDNPDAREHSFSLTYAKKEVNELTDKVDTAEKLWAW